MSQKTELQGNNADLQTILSKVNGLPSGSELGNATAADVASGKTFSSATGIKLTGTGAMKKDNPYYITDATVEPGSDVYRFKIKFDAKNIVNDAPLSSLGTYYWIDVMFHGDSTVTRAVVMMERSDTGFNFINSAYQSSVMRVSGVNINGIKANVSISVDANDIATVTVYTSSYGIFAEVNLQDPVAFVYRAMI